MHESPGNGRRHRHRRHHQRQARSRGRRWPIIGDSWGRGETGDTSRKLRKLAQGGKSGAAEEEKAKRCGGY